MATTGEARQETCAICHEVLPDARMALACSGCGCALHPSCASRIDRPPGWGNRDMFCAECAAERPAGALPW